MSAPRSVYILHRPLVSAEKPQSLKGRAGAALYKAGIGHWAVMIGDHLDGSRLELRRVGGRSFWDISPSSKEGWTYDICWDLGGVTSKSDKTIAAIADWIIDQRPLYFLDYSDCRYFALDLLYHLVDVPSDIISLLQQMLRENTNSVRNSAIEHLENVEYTKRRR